VIIETSALADHGYRALAGVDLGADAASLYDGRPLSRAARALAVAMHAHPRDALVLQGWPLRALSPAHLAAPPVGEAVGVPWRRLLTEVAAVAAPPETAPGAGPLRTRLPALMAALWAPLGLEPPPLRVLDCRPLGPRGRAVEAEGRLVIATSLGEPGHHALLQVFHEASHPVTDAAVRARLGADDRVRSTRKGAKGFAAHQAYEAAAVAWGGAVLEEAAPDLLPEWAAWRSRWGI
jgi:hypothetical protein